MTDGPDPRDGEAIARLRAAFESAGFTEDGAQEALKIDIASRGEILDVQVYERRVRDDSPLHTLIKLFLLGSVVPADRARAAFDPLSLEDAQALGLVAEAGGGVRRTVSITMVAGLWLAHDSFVRDPGRMRPDHVIGAGPASRTLAMLTVRRPVARALDLGTGCGVQALVAARHAEHVVGTDINARALRFAEFNATLNGLGNVECREGSLYEPVAGERFDLIAANPPFIISPERRFEYRDGGMPGDQISREVVRRAGEHLAPGGFASVLCNWAHRGVEDWQEPVRGWVEGTGCDAWVLRGDTQDPLGYAATWLSVHRRDRYGAALDRWLEYYARLGVGAISTGTVIMRRRTDGAPSGWFRGEHLPGTRASDATEHLLRMFRNQDYLELAGNDEEVLDGAYRVTTDHRIDQTLALREGGYELERVTVRFERGLSFSGTADGFILGVLAGCDGTHPLRDLVRAVAPAMEVDAGKLEPAAVEIVRQMLSLGFLEAPAPGPASPPGSDRD